MQINKTVLFLMLLCSFTFGQEQHKMEIGIHGAPAAAIFYGVRDFKKDFNVKYTPSLAFSAGISVQYNLKPRWSLLLEANYERKGNTAVLQNVLYENIVGKARQNYHADYLTLPVIAKIKFSEQKFPFYINVGGYMGYLKQFGWHSVGTNFNTKVKDNLNNYERIDYGLVTGIGKQFSIKEHFIFSIEGRNNLGLAPVVKGPTYNNKYIKNESFALLFGFAYKLNYGIGSTTK